MKKLASKLTVALGLMLLLIITVNSCKKGQKTEEPTPAPTSGLNGKIDGKDIAITESGLATTYYTSAGDAVNSLVTNATLDANGNKMTFFVPDVKAGTYTITPKLGTSSNPGNPALKILASTATTTQTYISYTSTGSVYYAISGTITIVVDDTMLSVKWDISFKDGTGRVFTSSGNFTIYFYKAVTKPKTDITDPTPVSAKPTIESLAPQAAQAGDEIAITGTNFSTVLTENMVKFNGTDAVVKTATATKITVNAPANGTTGAVSVKIKNSETTTGPVFTYTLPPTFTALSPATGKAGDVIILTGTNFSTVLTENAVAFNGLAATVKTATATTLTVEVPANVTTGLITIKVRAKDATLGTQFTPTFTVTAVVTNPIVVGTPGQAYSLQGNYMATTKAFDTDGNLYVIDENNVLYKMSYNGNILKTFTNSDFSLGLNISYKCLGVATDKTGGVHAMIYVNLFGSQGNTNNMVSIATDGKTTKEYTTTFYDSAALNGMAINSGGVVYVLSGRNNTDDVIKLNTDGTYDTYLKGGDSGDFGGNGAYSIDIDDSNNMYLVTYKKGPNSNSVPTNAAIYKFGKGKEKSTILSGYTDGFKDGDLATAQFKDIRCVAVSNQDLFVGDNGNFRIRKIDTRTSQVTTIAGNGKQYDPNNGNQPTYAGPLLSVNVFKSTGLLMNAVNGVLYNFYAGQNNIQKLVLNK